MQKINYQIELEKTLKELENQNKKPSLLLHVCCAPCSSYVLDYLKDLFDITIDYYNPNIYPESEFDYRLKELNRFIEEFGLKGKVTILKKDYDPNVFFDMAKGLEDVREGGERCFKCYELRLRHTAEIAQKLGYDYFTTTLSISPLKNAQKLNEIGKALSEEFDIKYLYSDFKKKNGYKQSIELSKQYNLYRQNYCGCIYSKPSSLN
ncbi:MAG: epoxyqueuosine reductase QueH [Lachnospiraceae bacterium]|nr:epoxyqueuosine reductase QueH [Lachnospiraceae bacterium]